MTDLDLSCPSHGVHNWIISAARRLRNAGGTNQETFDMLRELTRDVQHRTVPDREIESAVNRVYGTELDNSKPYTPRPTFDPDVLERFSAKAPAEVDAEWLKARSPLPTDRSPAFVLSRLFQPGDHILVFDKFASQGQYFWSHSNDLSWPDWLTNNNARSGDKDGVWFLSAPVDGKWHTNPRENKLSRRSEESITRYPYVVIESDEAPKALWLRAIARLPLPIVMITNSGGNSIHALVKVDCKTKQECDAVIARFEPTLVVLGADPGSLTAVRLTRLPNCYRASKRAWQELLYLNAEPDDTPIIERE
jgi:hypothetical protein